ncbi:hypothetical protein EYC54_04155 [Xanthomonas oryzae]|uniref:hypothetical protein n=1 Tax=Xanthomonas oryzae TaxID=347 RepID=UPI001033CBF5|nr:hypothetical protein [Xanthomonas oryzae]QBG87096.1 hypothetical protein EYC54_04155 [Xanthomonas oryzae]
MSLQDLRHLTIASLAPMACFCLVLRTDGVRHYTYDGRTYGMAMKFCTESVAGIVITPSVA